MKNTTNATHHQELKSWVESANDPSGDFPIQNLPFGIFRKRGSKESPRAGVAIGDQILDIAACSKQGLFTGQALRAAAACGDPSLNRLMSQGQTASSALRKQASKLLDASAWSKSKSQKLAGLLVPMSKAEIFLPAGIGDYSDFYASIQHATNIGKMFRPDNPLLPNYKYVPIGYHGRSSSIVPSGAQVIRPVGQTMSGQVLPPAFGPTNELDYELEIGIFIGVGNKQGAPVPIREAPQHIFGLCLVNDWSARDIQRWEYQPLGPFLSKGFCTSLSPWVVTCEALAPFRIPACKRPQGDPAPLSYLADEADSRAGGFDIRLSIRIQTGEMRKKGLQPLEVSRTSFAGMYWTAAQMVTHHASNGCNLRPGDLIASGTISGVSVNSTGSLIELTNRGSEPVMMPSGESRRFLEDGDEVVMTAWCERPGFARIGFGECRGRVAPHMPIE